MSLIFDLNAKFRDLDINIIGDYAVITDGLGVAIYETEVLADWVELVGEAKKSYDEFCQETDVLWCSHNTAGEKIEGELKEFLAGLVDAPEDVREDLLAECL